MSYLQLLFEEEKYEDAAQLCVKLLGKDKAAWEKQVYRFAQMRQLKVKPTAYVLHHNLITVLPHGRLRNIKCITERMRKTCLSVAIKLFNAK